MHNSARKEGSVEVQVKFENTEADVWLCNMSGLV